MSEAEPLTTLMASGPMPVQKVLRIGREAAMALTNVHGELWPSAVVVSDDGVAIVPPGSVDRNRYGQYAAPERILGKPATPESDVYSLAAILFHALVGRPPFRGSSPSEIMLAACADEPLPLRDFRADAPPELAKAIARSLSRDPAQRFSTPSVFAAELEKAEPHPTAFPGRRILIADDDAPVRDLHAYVAGLVGVEADVVASGRDAIAALKTRRYDVALLDLNMPRLSGWEVLDFLRSRQELKPNRLFIVTGFGDQLISEADRDLVTAVLYKPVAPEELRKLVTLCLNGEFVNVKTVLRVTGHRDATSMTGALYLR
jgi:CheY-like chemotaxis protein